MSSGTGRRWATVFTPTLVADMEIGDHPPGTAGLTMIGPTVSPSSSPPVDTAPSPTHFSGVSKKPRKIEEPKAAYPAKKPVKAAAVPKKTAAGDLEFKRIADKLFTERKELLHKLAQ